MTIFPNRSVSLLSLATCLAACFASGTALARPMTETDLVMLKRLAAPTVSPDGSLAAYQLRETDLEANKGRTDIYVLKLGGAAAEPSKIASKPEYNEHDPAFSPDGKYLYYISNESGSDQIWRTPINAAMPQQVSKFKTDVSGFKLSPNGKMLVVWGDVARQCNDMNCDGDVETRNLGKTAPSGDTSKPGPGSGREYNELMVRHWDTWETPGNYSRPFAYGLNADGTLYGGHAVDSDIKDGVIGDTPSKPSGGGEEIAWGADNETVYFTLRKADRNEAKSTNLDIYAGHQNYDTVANLTTANQATDTLPTPSPDGKWLAYAAMARAGYEADRQVLMLRNLKNNKVTALTEKWDRSVGSIAWSPDSKNLYVTAGEILDTPVFKVDLKGHVTRLTKDGHVSAALPLADGGLLYAMDSVSAPSDLYRRDKAGMVTQLTNVNAALLNELDKVDVQRFDFKGANGDQVWGQITKPANSNVQLPVALIVHGGPQGSFGNSWSFRWNPRVMAAQNLAIVSIDFHGSTGYGQAFTDSINKDWGGKPLEDLKLGMDAVAKIDTQLNTENACALGGSYGGYMMNWIEGNWPDRFKCLVTHAGIFDLRAMAYETEELWFDQWDNGGPWTTRSDAEKWNPVNHVAKWKTPALVIHGEKDFRIPYSQSLAAFTALQQQGVESKLLVFPDENHWILKPKNSLQWHGTVFQWLSKHLSAGAGD
jgi:dipeptidyl aminopeptidase/acylaminoacyl peptidase